MNSLQVVFGTLAGRRGYGHVCRQLTTGTGTGASAGRRDWFAVVAAASLAAVEDGTLRPGIAALNAEVTAKPARPIRRAGCPALRQAGRPPLRKTDTRDGRGLGRFPRLESRGWRTASRPTRTIKMIQPSHSTVRYRNKTVKNPCENFHD